MGETKPSGPADVNVGATGTAAEYNALIDYGDDIGTWVDAMQDGAFFPSCGYDTAGNIPGADADYAGRLYYETDTNKFKRDNGAGWDQLKPVNPRTIWAQAQDHTVDAQLHDRIGNYGSVVMLEAADRTVYFSFPIPTDFKTLIKAYLVYIAAGASAGAFYVGAASEWAADGEAYNTNSDSIGIAQIDGTATQVQYWDISALFTGILAGDLAGAAIQRDGTHVSDTAGVDMFIAGILLEYE